MLQEILSRLSRRDHPRTEAEVQADIRQFILEAPFELNEGDLDVVSLESPVTGGRRIDVEVGSAVIEVKRDLRRGRVVEEAVQQLGGYVRTRTSETGLRYVGVLTDGVEWRCYALAGEDLKQVSSLHVAADPESLQNLVFWLEGVLATAMNVAPTAKEIEARLGASSSAYALDRASIANLYERSKEQPTVKLKRELWARLLTSALGSQFTNDESLFIEHTLPRYLHRQRRDPRRRAGALRSLSDAGEISGGVQVSVGLSHGRRQNSRHRSVPLTGRGRMHAGRALGEAPRQATRRENPKRAAIEGSANVEAKNEGAGKIVLTSFVGTMAQPEPIFDGQARGGCQRIMTAARLAAIFVVDDVGHSRLMSENEAATAMMQPQIVLAQGHRRDAGGKPELAAEPVPAALPCRQA